MLQQAEGEKKTPAEKSFYMEPGELGRVKGSLWKHLEMASWSTLVAFGHLNVSPLAYTTLYYTSAVVTFPSIVS